MESNSYPHADCRYCQRYGRACGRHSSPELRWVDESESRYCLMCGRYAPTCPDWVRAQQASASTDTD